jgi:hypothetical protein
LTIGDLVKGFECKIGNRLEGLQPTRRKRAAKGEWTNVLAVEDGRHPVAVQKDRKDDRNDIWRLVVGDEVVAEVTAAIGAYGDREDRKALAKLIAKLLEHS